MSRFLILEYFYFLEEVTFYFKRRGSIKEFMYFFESKQEGIDEELRQVGRQRVYSVSLILGLR